MASGRDFEDLPARLANVSVRDQTVGGHARVHNGNIYNIYRNSSWQETKDREQQELLKAIFLTDPMIDRRSLVNSKGERVKDTCKWVLTHPLYISWLNAGSELLWISGGPGKGKTFMSIFLAEELERAALRSRDMTFIQFFCESQNEKQNTAIAIIRGLIFQLLQLHPGLFEYILPQFRIRKEDLFQGVSAFEMLWSIFENMIRHPGIGEVCCVLDGLDECETSLETLTKKLKSLFNDDCATSMPCHLKIIIVSRELPICISRAFTTSPRLNLDSDLDGEVTSDLRRFIRVNLDEYFPKRSTIDPWRDDLETILFKRAGGTFLWVGFAMTLLKEKSRIEVDDSLPSLPTGIEAMYERILLQIIESRREIAATILRWVVMAVRPLCLAELGDVINARPCAGLSVEEVVREQVSFCGYMLKIVSDEVNLVHQSAKDFLLKKRQVNDPRLERFYIDETEANVQIVQFCISYFHRGGYDKRRMTGNRLDLDQSSPRSGDGFPFLLYATIYWVTHAQSLPISAGHAFDLSQDFFDADSDVYMFWLGTYNSNPAVRRSANQGSVLHMAVIFGILPLVEKILCKMESETSLPRVNPADAIDPYDRSALYVAVSMRNETMVRLLLDRGASVAPLYQRPKYFKIPAVEVQAADKGVVPIMELLLEHGGNPNAQRGEPLARALRKGNQAMVRLLRQYGAT